MSGLLISIHAAREGGDSSSDTMHTRTAISIHAAREGGDNNPVAKDIPFKISIHAAREGGDVRSFTVPMIRTNFNPRRP